MSAASNPYGFIPVRHPTGQLRTYPYPIASGYATAIFKYMPVILNATGQLIAGTAAADLLGVFDGVEYNDQLGKRVVSNNWAANTVATNVTAWVWDSADTEFSVQADGSVTAAQVGHQSDVSNVGAGSATTGMSQATLSSAGITATGAQGQFRIVDFDKAVDNVAGDAFTKVIVKIARHQYVANKVSL